MIQVPRSPAPHARVRDGEMPCQVCDRGVKHDSPTAVWVHLHCGGSHIVTEPEAEALNAAGEEGGDMYFYPIGADCLRKHPELWPYVPEGQRERLPRRARAAATPPSA